MSTDPAALRQWSENEDEAVTTAESSFEFRTKAQNLVQLEGKLTHSHILPIEILKVGEWDRDPAACVSRVQSRFGTDRIIVRSSATDEDTADASMAGAFDSITNVDSTDPKAIRAAVDAVAESYRVKGVVSPADQEVLIQPMVKSVILSGVLFTRDLERNLPYFVVNYEESDQTDSITAGTTSAPQRTYRVFKRVSYDTLPHPLDRIIPAAHEIEQATGSTTLDIEFAMNADHEFFLLQVRPLVRTQLISHALLDRRLTDQIEAMKELVAERLKPRPGLYGRTTALGEMPDWNPAEIIGTHPTTLATSLYRFIIMNSIWRDARGALGYRNPAPHQLLVSVAGRPYVDVRSSTNSFLPAGLSADLADRLIDHYVDQLREHPEFHDKIEFEIVFSSHTFDIEDDQARLRAAGFTDAEVRELWERLFELTEAAVCDTDARTRRFEADVAELADRRNALLAIPRADDIPFRVEQLLEDCRRFGTLPFSIAARCAFIATSFLRSMVSRGVLSDDGFVRYTNSIDTVASDLVRDLERLRTAEIPLAEFLSNYGHLRPGTYDVRAFSYADRPDEYLTLSPTVASQDDQQVESGHATELTLRDVVDLEGLQNLINEFGFGFDVDQLDRFIKESVRQREWLKFEFTKNLSRVLDLLASFGRHHGMSRDDVAFVDIDNLLRLANESAGREEVASLKEEVERRRKLYELTSTLPLPDLIFSTQDIEVVSNQRRKPNFVTQRSITAHMIQLTDASVIPADEELVGKIVLIENADPGYDWLFSKGIAGLCTKYGGAASHMTIRCAEFGTPAAIGCGEQIFSELRIAPMVHLNCGQQIVEPHGT